VDEEIVCGKIKNEAVQLGKNILQILVQMGIYSPQRKYMFQKEVVTTLSNLLCRRKCWHAYFYSIHEYTMAGWICADSFAPNNESLA
jgi:hypothetical protein